MPIKDDEKRRVYFREYMRKRRAGTSDDAVRKGRAAGTEADSEIAKLKSENDLLRRKLTTAEAYIVRLEARERPQGASSRSASDSPLEQKLRENAEKLKVLWKKGHNFYATFFTILKQARDRKADNEEFTQWCFDELHIGASVITKMAKTLHGSGIPDVQRDANPMTEDVMNDDDEIQKLKVLWKKGRNMVASFFTELANARREIGDDVNFAQWCATELHIPLRIIIKMTQALREADAIRTKEEFMPARQAELAHKRRERELQSSE
jgi:hypothetical protein